VPPGPGHCRGAARFLLETIFVLLGALHFVERVRHFGRRSGKLDCHLIDGDAHLVAVGDALGDLLNLGRYARLVVAEDVLRRPAAHNLAHGAL
jgi:hypothetical protein